jgi:hypothetical protein
MFSPTWPTVPTTHAGAPASSPSNGPRPLMGRARRIARNCAAPAAGPSTATTGSPPTSLRPCWSSTSSPDPARPTGRFTLTEAGPGRTTVTFTLELRPTGLLRLMNGMIAKTMWSEVNQTVPAEGRPREDHMTQSRLSLLFLGGAAHSCVLPDGHRDPCCEPRDRQRAGLICGVPVARVRKPGKPVPPHSGEATVINAIRWRIRTGSPWRDTSARRRRPEKGDDQRHPPGGVDTEPNDHALGRSSVTMLPAALCWGGREYSPTGRREPAG